MTRKQITKLPMNFDEYRILINIMQQELKEALTELRELPTSKLISKSYIHLQLERLSVNLDKLNI